MSSTQTRTLASRVNRNQYTEMHIKQRPTLEQMALATSMPPPRDFMGLGAWVEHLSAPRRESVATLIEEMLGYPQVSEEIYIHLHHLPPPSLPLFPVFSFSF